MLIEILIFMLDKDYTGKLKFSKSQVLEKHLKKKQGETNSRNI